jgi:hypothetical protein
VAGDDGAEAAREELLTPEGLAAMAALSGSPSAMVSRRSLSTAATDAATADTEASPSATPRLHPAVWPAATWTSRPGLLRSLPSLAVGLAERDCLAPLRGGGAYPHTVVADTVVAGESLRTQRLHPSSLVGHDDARDDCVSDACVIGDRSDRR